MRYMVVERFKDGSAAAIYERLRQHGRMLPEGLEYVDGWVAATLDRCFQLMDCDDERLFEEWFAAWSDLVDFELVRVVSSSEASARALASGEAG